MRPTGGGREYLRVAWMSNIAMSALQSNRSAPLFSRIKKDTTHIMLSS
jgi:hypothetical protein